MGGDGRSRMPLFQLDPQAVTFMKSDNILATPTLHHLLSFSGEFFNLDE